MADALNAPLGTIKRRLHTARKRLRAELEAVAVDSEEWSESTFDRSRRRRNGLAVGGRVRTVTCVNWLTSENRRAMRQPSPGRFRTRERPFLCSRQFTQIRPALSRPQLARNRARRVRRSVRKTSAEPRSTRPRRAAERGEHADDDRAEIPRLTSRQHDQGASVTGSVARRSARRRVGDAPACERQTPLSGVPARGQNRDRRSGGCTFIGGPRLGSAWRQHSFDLVGLRPPSPDSAWLTNRVEPLVATRRRASSGRAQGDHREPFHVVGVEGAEQVHVGPGEGLRESAGGGVIGVGFVAPQDRGAAARVVGRDQAAERQPESRLRRAKGSTIFPPRRTRLAKPTPTRASGRRSSQRCPAIRPRRRRVRACVSARGPSRRHRR